MIFIGNIVINGKEALKECTEQQQCKEQKERSKNNVRSSKK